MKEIRGNARPTNDRVHAVGIKETYENRQNCRESVSESDWRVIIDGYTVILLLRRMARQDQNKTEENPKDENLHMNRTTDHISTKKTEEDRRRRRDRQRQLRCADRERSRLMVELLRMAMEHCIRGR